MSVTETGSAKLGILHLSDIHLSKQTDLLTTRLPAFHRAYRDDFQGCDTVFVVLSGDIANKGFQEEYELALNMLNQISEFISERYTDVPCKFILVPGNHDCNFAKETQVRRNAVVNIDYDTLGNDTSVLDSCIDVQTDFWEFYSLFHELPQNKVYYQVTTAINTKTVCFHCFNTAWMSHLREQPGSLFFPVKLMPELKHDNDFDVNIAIFHHPISWFNPNTVDNNKREFQQLVDAISSLQVVGHEHENELRKTENLDHPESHTLCFTSEIFQDLGDPNRSGFQTLNLDLNTNDFLLRRYQWKDSIYIRYSEKSLSLEKKPRRPIELSHSFLDELEKIDVPIFFGGREAKLSEIFVYHDLESMDPKHTEEVEEYLDAESLVQIQRGSVHVLEGECQIGKSSLLHMLLLSCYQRGLYPLLLTGADISSKNPDKVIRQAFKRQYVINDESFERFRQLPKNKKVLLVDDLHTCQLNKSARHEFIDNAHDLFSTMFITIDTAHSMLPECQSTIKNLSAFSMKPLGYAKRNLLVEKYLRCKMRFTGSSDDLFEQTKEVFDKLSHVLGDKLVPPYPVFVLTILQSLDYTPLNTNETSYGFCYQTLIHLALHRVGVPKDHMGSYVNFSSELAYEIFRSGSMSITDVELEKFYGNYSSRFWVPEYGEIRKNIIDSKILKSEYGVYEFSYIYVLYFLAAKKIAETIDTPEGQSIVNGLFENLYDEKVANTLVFITHHSKNSAFIQESVFNAMLPFEDTPPITLEKKCHYNNLLQDLVKEIKQEVLELKDPTQERTRLLEEHDIQERQECASEEDTQNDDSNLHLRPFLHAFRSIEIVGQIVKNQKGSLETATLKHMITELYLAGFRMISYLGELIRDGKDDLALRIEEKVSNRDKNDDVERKVLRFLQFISLQACLGTFSKFIHHVGVRELRQLFNEVAEEIGTPAARLVSFSINSYYGKINIKELEELADSLEGNVVALQILRSRVRAYLYNNYVDYRQKQKIGACLKIIVPATLGHKERGF